MATKVLNHDEESVLTDAYEERDTMQFKRNGLWGWLRPMDLGGSNGSHHSQTLAMLVKLGLMQKTLRGGLGPRASYLYRITDEGEIKAQEILQRKKFQSNVS